MRNGVGNQNGFTVMELIALLIILGILAAVVIPKYYDLVLISQQKALQAGVAEAKGRVLQYGIKYCVDNAAWPSASEYNDTNLGSDAGDFVLSFASSGTQISIAVNGKGNPIPATVSTTILVALPGTE